MSDSMSETKKLQELFDIIRGLPVLNVNPLDLILMEPDCLQKKLVKGRLAKSVVNFGICSPFLVDCNNLVLDGRKRLEFAINAEMKSVPIKRITVPLTDGERYSIRFIANPESRRAPGFADMFSGTRASLPVKHVIERAKRTVNSRSMIDLRLQKENKVYEASLAQAAMHAVNSIGCIDSIMRNTDTGKDYLEKARKFLEKSIRYTVHSGFTKEKSVASSVCENIQEDAQEESF